MAESPLIVIIEDDAATLEYLTMFLELSGYRVQGALSGTDGWHAISREAPQAILLDRRLPDTDGLVLCREIHDRLGADVPLIMMSADAEVGLLAASKVACATHLLRKPFLPQQLLDALSAALGA